MSSKPDLSKPLSQEEIDELLTRHPLETVQYWAALSNELAAENSGEEPEDSEPEDTETDPNGAEIPPPAGDGYEEMTNPLLQDELESRGLPKSGNKDELIARLREDDSK